jgi:hypothetical protein
VTPGEKWHSRVDITEVSNEGLLNNSHSLRKTSFCSRQEASVARSSGAEWMTTNQSELGTEGVVGIADP